MPTILSNRSYVWTIENVGQGKSSQCLPDGFFLPVEAVKDEYVVLRVIREKRNSNTFISNRERSSWEKNTRLSHDMWFPKIWHFDKCRLRWACAASSKA